MASADLSVFAKLLARNTVVLREPTRVVFRISQPPLRSYLPNSGGRPANSRAASGYVLIASDSSRNSGSRQSLFLTRIPRRNLFYVRVLACRQTLLLCGHGCRHRSHPTTEEYSLLRPKRRPQQVRNGEQTDETKCWNRNRVAHAGDWPFCAIAGATA